MGGSLTISVLFEVFVEEVLAALVATGVEVFAALVALVATALVALVAMEVEVFVEVPFVPPRFRPTPFFSGGF